MVAALLSGCVTKETIVVKCPQLEPPPHVVIDALEATRDFDAYRWADALDRHLSKLATCWSE